MDIGGYVNNKVHIAGHNIAKQRGTLWMKAHQITSPVWKFHGWIRQIPFPTKWLELKISKNDCKSWEFFSFERVFIKQLQFFPSNRNLINVRKFSVLNCVKKSDIKCHNKMNKWLYLHFASTRTFLHIKALPCVLPILMIVRGIYQKSVLSNTCPI